MTQPLETLCLLDGARQIQGVHRLIIQHFWSIRKSAQFVGGLQTAETEEMMSRLILAICQLWKLCELFIVSAVSLLIGKRRTTTTALYHIGGITFIRCPVPSRHLMDGSH